MWRVTSTLAERPDWLGVAPARTPTLSLSPIVRRADHRAAGANTHVQTVDAERAAHPVQRPVTTACELRRDLRKLQGLRRRQVARRRLKQDARPCRCLRVFIVTPSHGLIAPAASEACGGATSHSGL
jgi:hypothetical protein